MERGRRPRPFIGIWPRGGGKSTGAELATVAIGARRVRRYAWYVRATQEMADRSVENIAAMLESPMVEVYYPDLARPQRGKYGNVRGWRRERLRTASGFTVDAIGFDTARRGAKVEEDRPGLMIFDDLDGKHDGPEATRKKVEILTTSLLPAGGPDLAVLGIQNLVIPDGVFSRLADGRAEFLADRIVSGPHPAIRHLAVDQQEGRFVITAGEPTWAGQDLAVCQEQMNDWGYSAFLQEAQHDVMDPAGGIFSHLDYQRIAWEELPDLVRVVVWVDPAVTATDHSDAMGIQADGIDAAGHIYRLYSWEDRTTPEDALRRAIAKAVELGAEAVGVETDQGGDTWASVYAQAVQQLGLESPPPFRSARAGAGHGPKVHRAQQMLADYERGLITHVQGTHHALERALRRFPVLKPYDLVDAAYWSWQDLRQPAGAVGFVL